MPTLYQVHENKWKGCTRCSLHETRKKVCLFRGTIPCDMLFVGEAPGVSENLLGQPFVGPAGKLLDEIIKDGFSGAEGISYALTNLIGCIPLDEDGQKTAEPEPDAIEACAPRVQEFVRLAEPQVIVTVGTLSRDYLSPAARGWKIEVDPKIKQIHIVHPAAILRMNVAQRGLAVQRCVVTLGNAAENLIPF